MRVDVLRREAAAVTEQEVALVHPGAYRGNKRQKELRRLQKQEEKRQKRLQKKTGEPEELDPDAPQPSAEESLPVGQQEPAKPQADEPSTES